MIPISVKPLSFLACVAAGLIAGFFYTWSFTIMHSLDLIDAKEAAASMVSINANIRNGWFAAIFFGAPVLVLLAFLMSFTVANNKHRIWTCFALLFAVSTLAITFTIHLPLNEQLANGLEWAKYSGPWVQWNHARMATSLLAFASMVGAVLCVRND